MPNETAGILGNGTCAERQREIERKNERKKRGWGEMRLSGSGHGVTYKPQKKVVNYKIRQELNQL